MKQNELKDKKNEPPRKSLLEHRVRDRDKSSTALIVSGTTQPYNKIDSVLVVKIASY